jgi:hypothetical protein
MLKLKIINFKKEIKKRQVKLDNSSKLKSLIIQDKKKKTNRNKNNKDKICYRNKMKENNEGLN